MFLQAEMMTGKSETKLKPVLPSDFVNFGHDILNRQGVRLRGQKREREKKEGNKGRKERDREGVREGGRKKAKKEGEGLPSP